MNGLAARATITRTMYRELSRGYRLRLLEATERCERNLPPPPHGYDTRMLVDPLERKRAWRITLGQYKRTIAYLMSGTTALSQSLINAHAAATALRLALMPTHTPPAGRRAA